MGILKHIPLIGVHVLIYGLIWWIGGGAVVFGTFAFGTLLIWISCRDVILFEIPDVAVVLLLLLGIGMAADWIWAVGSTVLWAALYLAVREGARIWTGRHALGLGDVKLIAGVASMLGPFEPIYVTLYASVAATVTLISITLLRGGKISEIEGTDIAFGPFLCLSAWGIWMWGTGL